MDTCPGEEVVSMDTCPGEDVSMDGAIVAWTEIRNNICDVPLIQIGKDSIRAQNWCTEE